MRARTGAPSPLRHTKALRVFAVTGSVLAFLPVAAPFVIALVSLATGGGWRFDYLMPAELGFLFIASALVLGALAIVCRRRRFAVFGAILAAVILIVGAQALAVVTGLADGRIPPEGPWFIAVVAGLVGYTLAVLGLGIAGIFLARDLRSASSGMGKDPGPDAV